MPKPVSYYFRIVTNGMQFRVQKSFFGLFWYNAYWDDKWNTFDTLETAQDKLRQLITINSTKNVKKGKWVVVR